MTEQSIREYTAAMWSRYQAAHRTEKGRRLCECGAVTGHHRPAAGLRTTPAALATDPASPATITLGRQVPIRTFGDWDDVSRL